MLALHTFFGIRNTLRIKVLSIAVAWTCGLLLGAYFIRQTALFSVMCSARFCRISIVGLLLSLALPILLSCILLRFLRFHFILPLVMLKACSFFSSYAGLMIAYGNAGWLVSSMLLFSDFFLVVILLLLWFNAAVGKRFKPFFCFIVYGVLPMVVGCFDYFVVSPYVAMLLDY